MKTIEVARKNAEPTAMPAEPETPAPIPAEPEPAPAPAEKQAPGETVEFEYRGVTFTIPKDRDAWPMDAELAIEQRQWGIVVRAVIGDTQWDDLRDVAPNRGDLFEFIRLFMGAAAEGCIN
jgi:hypothetical protein